MPKIYLKPKSPEFDTGKTHQKTKGCDMPGCPQEGEYRAPKDRSLTEHHWFCFDHVREYNQAWDFFDGMNAREVEDHILKSMYGDRPTWRVDSGEMNPEAFLSRKAADMRGGTGEYGDSEDAHARAQERRIDRTSPEFEALAIFGLELPITTEEIKRRYKELAKKHHPDFNPNDAQAEEVFKQINMAYTVLKMAGEKFSAMG